MPTPEPVPPRSTVTPPWRSRLLAWPGVLTLLSVLAVLLGHHPPMPDQGPRATAGTVAPALPELRPAPQPTPAPALSAASPPEPFRVAERADRALGHLPIWAPPLPERSLALLGRRQTDGG
ncbi:hypothetical protein DAETH_14390 [Deinococcus aetherius]|uniref:Uncharacterized protein n=1 Tax=Deinococcus aetherius TaxID=200252 RepID=A0ABM8ACE9_9DEIO|nr:hypothetical protein [Deinococcus aetherius]BDP41470.1 hypothetical protein DAETH_14390 [Deinococcus aetherius]